MLTKLTKIERGDPERVEIFCYAVTDEVREIVAFVKSRQGKLTGSIDDRQYEVPLTDIFYIESVDNKVFLYTKDKVYETKQKIYEFESVLKAKHYLRISKSMLLNLMKVESIRPALNGRFSAMLRSGEQVIITRKYVPDLKRALKGDTEYDR
jgi:DNA-binding LytR/AlgR family response regulator